VSEYQAAFTDALRGGRQMRKRLFDTIEQRHVHDFADGRVGTRLYEHILSAVRESRVPEAIEEYETRFFPLLNADPPPRRADIGSPEDIAGEDLAIAVRARRPTAWGGIFAVCLAALFGAFILAFGAFKMTAEEPGLIQAAIPATKLAEPVSEAMTEPATALAAEAPDLKATDPESETITDGLRAMPVQQEPAPED
jgi:hypothetical protein